MMQITRKQGWLLNKTDEELNEIKLSFRNKILYIMPDTHFIDTVLILINAGHSRFAIKTAKEDENFWKNTKKEDEHFWKNTDRNIVKLKAPIYGYECTICYLTILPDTYCYGFKPLFNPKSWYMIDEKCAYKMANFSMHILQEITLKELKSHFQKFLLICDYIGEDILGLVKQTYIQVFWQEESFH